MDPIQGLIENRYKYKRTNTVMGWIKHILLCILSIFVEKKDRQ